MFQNLTVLGVGATVSYQPTIGSILNPFNLIGAIQEMIHPQVRELVSGLEGVVSPGEMLRELLDFRVPFPFSNPSVSRIG